MPALASAFLLLPSHLKGCYRLLTIGRKYLPKRDPNAKQKRPDICWGKVLEVSDIMSNLKEALGEKQYDTKTRGVQASGVLDHRARLADKSNDRRHAPHWAGKSGRLRSLPDALGES